MSLPVIIRPRAEEDIEETRESYEQARQGPGERFAASLRQVLEQIEAMPESFGAVWRDVRAVRLRKFPHVVYYIVFPDRVEVLAALHGARDPSAWRSRI